MRQDKILGGQPMFFFNDKRRCGGKCSCGNCGQNGMSDSPDGNVIIPNGVTGSISIPGSCGSCGCGKCGGCNPCGCN